MAIIEWTTIKDLSEEPLSELWGLLGDIENNLEIEAPSNSISVALFPKECNSQIQKERHCRIRKQLLKQLEKTEKVLKILKKPKQDTDFAHIKVDKNKFYSLYKEVEEGIERLGQGIIPHKLSSFLNIKWEDITIQFLDGHEVIIKIKGFTRHTDYEEMGFQDKKRKLPNKQWEFLKDLSETNGELSWRNPRATVKGKKQKQLLAERLKKYFQIDEDPFDCYRKEKTYKIKINLIAETKSTTNSKKQKENNESIEEYRKEQCPEI